MKNNNIWCYFGIVFLLILILLPPVLRIFVPKKEDPADLITVKKILSCSSDTYIVNSSYEDGKLAIFAIKQLKEEENVIESNEEMDDSLQDESEASSSDNASTDTIKPDTNKNIDTNHPKNDETMKTELDKLFEEIEAAHQGEVISQNDGKIYTADFSLETSTDSYFEKINRTLETQKIFYETQGLVCSIM